MHIPTLPFKQHFTNLIRTHTILCISLDYTLSLRYFSISVLQSLYFSTLPFAHRLTALITFCFYLAVSAKCWALIMHERKKDRDEEVAVVHLVVGPLYILFTPSFCRSLWKRLRNLFLKKKKTKKLRES